MKSTSMKITCVSICIAATMLVVWSAISQYRAHYRNAIRKVITPGEWASDGSAAEIAIGENDSDEARVVLIFHRGANARHSGENEQQSISSAEEPDIGRTSTWRMTTNSDPAKSGAWIDGDKIELSERVNVVYTSAQYQATRVDIHPDDEAAFADALRDMARSNKTFDFIDKWILPRLPPAPPRPTVVETIRSLQPRGASKASSTKPHDPCADDLQTTTREL